MPVDAAQPGISTITKEELARRLEGAQVVQIVSVLDSKYFNLGSNKLIKTCASHQQETPRSYDFIYENVFIKGSKIIMLDQLKSRLNELDKKQEVVTYGTGDDPSPAFTAAEILFTHGFKVRVFEGGIKEWEKAGLPTD
jgi:rhodanese-related sulfurtransferase